MFAKVVVYFLVAFATRKWAVCVIFAGGLRPTSKNYTVFVYRVAEGHSIQLLYFGRRQPPKILSTLM